MVPVLEIVVNYNNQSGPVIPIVHNLYTCVGVHCMWRMRSNTFNYNLLKLRHMHDVA